MKYHIHVTSKDPFGFNMIENIIELAKRGATIKPDTLPFMSFPHSTSMVLETDEAPTPTAFMRWFEYDTNKEVYATFVEAKAAEFSMDAEPDISLATNDKGEPWTKEQLDAMDWETEFKAVCKSVGITGRSRDKMTKEYLAKAAA